MVNFLPFTGYLANPKLVRFMLIPPIEFSNKRMIRKMIKKHPESVLKMAHPDYNLQKPTIEQMYKAGR